MLSNDLSQNSATTTYYPAMVQRIASVGWVIEYYVLNPQTNKMVRKRIKLNRLRKHCLNAGDFRARANEMAVHINARLSGGWNPFFEESNPRLYMKLAEVMQAYIDEKEKELRRDTLRCYKSFANLFVAWVNVNAAGVYASMFTKMHAVRYMDHVYNERKVGARAWNNQLKMARAFFSWCVAKCYAKDNPFATIKTKRADKKKRVIVPPETRAAIAAHLSDAPQLLMALQMVFSSLLRPKELRLVQIKHIDVERRAIRVPGDNAKTHNERFAPLSAQTAKRLESIDLAKFPKDYYLFGIGTDMMPDKKPIAEARLRKEWEKLRSALGMPQEMQLYSLRDTGINAMLKGGLDPLTVMQAADHHDLAMTTRYANHADPLIINKVYENSPKF